MPSKKSTRSKRTTSKNKNQGSTRKRKQSTKKSTRAVTWNLGIGNAKLMDDYSILP